MNTNSVFTATKLDLIVTSLLSRQWKCDILTTDNILLYGAGIKLIEINNTNVVDSFRLSTICPIFSTYLFVSSEEGKIVSGFIPFGEILVIFRTRIVHCMYKWHISWSLLFYLDLHVWLDLLPSHFSSTLDVPSGDLQTVPPIQIHRLDHHYQQQQ